jgi:hypothetical protein
VEVVWKHKKHGTSEESGQIDGNNMLVDFCELQEATKDGNNNVPNNHEPVDELLCQGDMGESSELEDEDPSRTKENISKLFSMG